MTMGRPGWPKTWLAETPGRVCPSCGARAGRPILWGMPSADVFGAIEAGEIDIRLGGCCVSDDDATHECRACDALFDSRSHQPGK